MNDRLTCSRGSQVGSFSESLLCKIGDRIYHSQGRYIMVNWRVEEKLAGIRMRESPVASTTIEA